MFDVEHGVEFGLAPGPRAVGLTVATGRLRALAVTSATRSEALPDVPTIGDFLPGYEVTTWFGIGAPSKPPVEIIMKLNNEINAALADPKIRAQLADLGGTALLTGSPAGRTTASRRSGLSGVMARQRVREFYDRAGINRFPLSDFLTQRLNTRSHAGERGVDGLLVPVLNFLLDFPERTRHDLPLEVPLAADELGSGRAFTRYELVEIVAPTLHFAVGQIAALLTLTGEATLLLLTRLPPRVVEPVLPRRNLKVAKKLLKLIGRHAITIFMPSPFCRQPCQRARITQSPGNRECQLQADGIDLP
jgi:hypothetical protein